MPQTPVQVAPPTRLPWPPVLLASAAAVAFLLGQWVPLAWPGVDDTATRMVGRGIGAAGLALLIWSVWTLKRHGTTVRPDKTADVLVTDGPFRFRRNPIYLAHVMILFGVAEITKNIWFVIFAVVYGALVTWLAILPEERHLEARFGETYRNYKHRTRRLI